MVVIDHNPNVFSWNLTEFTRRQPWWFELLQSYDSSVSMSFKSYGLCRLAKSYDGRLVLAAGPPTRSAMVVGRSEVGAHTSRALPIPVVAFGSSLTLVAIHVGILIESRCGEDNHGRMRHRARIR